jgi:predicted amidohydrolase
VSADLLVFELAEGDFEFTDSHMKTRKGTRMIEPRAVVKKGIVHRPGTIDFQLRPLYDFDRELLNQVAMGS